MLQVDESVEVPFFYSHYFCFFFQILFIPCIDQTVLTQNVQIWKHCESKWKQWPDLVVRDPEMSIKKPELVAGAIDQGGVRRGKLQTLWTMSMEVVKKRRSILPIAFLRLRLELVSITNHIPVIVANWMNLNL